MDVNLQGETNCPFTVIRFALWVICKKFLLKTSLNITEFVQTNTQSLVDTQGKFFHRT